MNYSAIEYTLSQKSLDIYLSGCSAEPKCEGCHNPELWDFNVGFDIENSYQIIENYINDYPNLINNIMIFGGEPLDQDIDKLKEFLVKLQKYNKKIWLFTRHYIFNVPNFIRCVCDYIKVGKYIPILKCDYNIQYGIKLATSNQMIFRL